MKKVMSVGQCPPDHAAIKYFIEDNFDAKIIKIDSTEEALEELTKQKIDLVLVNRKLDIDYTDGSILIQKMNQAGLLADTPIMLISNFPEYQQEAITLGAKMGFGKNDLGSSQTRDYLAGFLALK